MARVRTVQRVIVQSAATLSESLSAWTTLEWLEFDGYCEGADQVIGNASFHAGYGRRTPYNQARPELVGLPQVLGVPAPEWLGGKLIRVLVEDPGGDVSIGGVDYTMGFVGPVTWVGVFPDGGDDDTSGGLVQVTAAGSGALLDQAVVRSGYVVNGAGTELTNPGYCPPFNALPYGDHVLFGGTTDAHCLDDQSITDFWTARQMIEYLLDDVGGSIAFTISDPDGCLGYQVEAVDVHGWTLFQVLVFLTVRRGLTFHLRPLGNFVTILIRSTSAVAITVGGFTLPASTVTTSFDLRGDVWYSEPSVTYDYSSVYDVIEVEGGRPLIGITVKAWEIAWAAPELSTWNDNPTASGTEAVHRLFRVQASWNHGNAEGSDGLRDQRTAATSSEYGETGFTGLRQWSESAQVAPARSLTVEPFIPWSVSFGAELAGDRPEPVVVVGSGPNGYVDATKLFGWGVQVGSQPLSVRLIDGFNGAEVAGYDNLAGGAEIHVTLGIREAAPLLVSWRRPQADWPRPSPRTKTVRVPGFEQWICLAGMVTGVNEDGSIRTLATQRTIRDDVPRMRAYLALLRAFFAEPSVIVTLSDRGIIDVSAANRPATLVEEFITGSATLTPAAVITRRDVRRVVRDGVPMYDTSYVTESRAPDLEAVL